MIFTLLEEGVAVGFGLLLGLVDGLKLGLSEGEGEITVVPVGLAVWLLRLLYKTKPPITSSAITPSVNHSGPDEFIIIIILV